MKISESKVREIISGFLDVPLIKEKLEIYGKQKEFDLVNTERRIVGDIKRPEYKGGSPAGLIDSINRDIWLMEKLEASTGRRWRKMIVGWGNQKIFDDYARTHDSWISDVEIYFINNNDEVHEIRRDL